MRAGVGDDKLVMQFYTEIRAKRMQVEFRIFRYCLRFDVNHPTAAYERDYKHRTRVAYNGQSGMWELLLTTRKSVLEGMQFSP